MLHTYQSLAPLKAVWTHCILSICRWMPGLLPPPGSREKRSVYWRTNVCPRPCFQVIRVYTPKRNSWRREWLPTPVFWPREFHGPRSLAGYIQSMGLPRVRHNWATFRCGNSMNFFRNHHTVFYSSSIILLSHQECTEVPISPHPHQHLLFLFVLIMTILMGMKWYLFVVLICVSMMISDVEHLVLRLLAT